MSSHCEPRGTPAAGNAFALGAQSGAEGVGESVECGAL